MTTLPDPPSRFPKGKFNNEEDRQRHNQWIFDRKDYYGKVLQALGIWEDTWQGIYGEGHLVMVLATKLAEARRKNRSHRQQLRLYRKEGRSQVVEDSIREIRAAKDADLVAKELELRELVAKNRRLSREVKQLQDAIEDKNRRLDAMHVIWCTGGCQGGAHRYDGKGPDGITRELVERAIRETTRLVTYYNNAEFKAMDELDKLDPDFGKPKSRWVYHKRVKAYEKAKEVAQSLGLDAAWKKLTGELEES